MRFKKLSRRHTGNLVAHCFISHATRPIGIIAPAVPELVRDWPYSSFHRDAGTGVIAVDWDGDIEAIGEFGERWDR